METNLEASFGNRNATKIDTAERVSDPSARVTKQNMRHGGYMEENEK